MHSARRTFAPCERAEMRMGLSATPRRWFDACGTDILFSYFSGVVYEFPLEDAIGKYLTHYNYHPMPVELSAGGNGRVPRVVGTDCVGGEASETDERESARLEKLLLERARLVWRAENKLSAAVALVSRLKSEGMASGDGLHHALVYCAPGEHSMVLRQLSSLGLRRHEFVHYVSVRIAQRSSKHLRTETLRSSWP